MGQLLLCGSPCFAHRALRCRRPRCRVSRRVGPRGITKQGVPLRVSVDMYHDVSVRWKAATPSQELQPAWGNILVSPGPRCRHSAALWKRVQVMWESGVPVVREGVHPLRTAGTHKFTSATAVWSAHARGYCLEVTGPVLPLPCPTARPAHSVASRPERAGSRSCRWQQCAGPPGGPHGACARPARVAPPSRADLCSVLARGNPGARGQGLTITSG